MKKFKYLFLLCLCLSMSSYALDSNVFFSKSLTCPENFPKFSPTYSYPFATNYFEIYTNSYKPNSKSTPFASINVIADNYQDAQSSAVIIANSGLIAYSTQPIPLHGTNMLYCAYHSSAYPFPNISPNSATYNLTQVAYVEMLAPGNHNK